MENVNMKVEIRVCVYKSRNIRDCQQMARYGREVYKILTTLKRNHPTTLLLSGLYIPEGLRQYISVICLFIYFYLLQYWELNPELSH